MAVICTARFSSFLSRNRTEKLILGQKNASLWKKRLVECISSLHTSQKIDNSYRKLGTTVTETEMSQQAKNPVVVILGWNGAKDKHLAKYSDIFTQRNYGTVRVTANPFDTFCRLDNKVKQNSLQVLKVLDYMDCTERPVIFYAFSQGGGAVFYHMMRALTTPQSEYFDKFKVAGTIFDSCPLKLDISGKTRLLKSITDNMANPVLKMAVWYGLGIIVEVAVRFSKVAPRYMDDMKSSPWRCKQLVFYSKADLYSPHDDISDYIDARRERGVSVVSKCWENSAHVSHFKEHPDEYLKLLDDFINDCMSTYMGNADNKILY